MVKLWEVSSIAKVALKRGVQLTTSERMAEEIKVNNHAFSYSTNQNCGLCFCSFGFSLFRSWFSIP